jgi:hypothetical protein
LYREDKSYERCAPEASLRTVETIPKGGRQLASYPGLRFGPPNVNVKFGEWSDSTYVHGYGESGTFAFDDNYGTIRASRLIGFHDSFKRHHGKDYLNSWIVLPPGSKDMISNTWIAVSEMLNFRPLAFDDSVLNRRKRGEKGLRDALYVYFAPSRDL